MSDWRIAGDVMGGVVRNAFGRGDLRAGLLRHIWIELKRFGAVNVQNVPLSRIRGIDEVVVSGPVVRHGLLVLSALSAVLECERIFAFGADTHDTCRVMARNQAGVRIYRLGRAQPQAMPDVHRAAPETAPITCLNGDPETFDFAPYSGTIDLVYIDGAAEADDIRSATDAAFTLLSELGTIVWDNYTQSAGAYAYLNRLAPDLDGPVFHILGTPLALYSRWDIVRPSD